MHSMKPVRSFHTFSDLKSYEISCVSDRKSYEFSCVSDLKSYEISCVSDFKSYEISCVSDLKSYEISCVSDLKSYEISCVSDLKSYEISRVSDLKSYEISCVSDLKSYEISCVSDRKSYEFSCVSDLKSYEISCVSDLKSYEVSCVSDLKSYEISCVSDLKSYEISCVSDLKSYEISLPYSLRDPFFPVGKAWQEGYVDEWAQVQGQYPKVAPINLGNGGYSGTTAMYVPLAVQQKAHQTEGISLDFYRDYNMSWRTPGSYFSPPGDIDVSRLHPCADTVLMSNALMGMYLDLTGDAEGVVVDSEGFVVAKCFADHFWYAPACRADPGTCLTWLTAGTGWGMPEGLLKATIYNIPLATAVASTFQSYANLPTDFNVMLFWWVPDPTFLRPVKC